MGLSFSRRPFQPTTSPSAAFGEKSCVRGQRGSGGDLLLSPLNTVFRRLRQLPSRGGAESTGASLIRQAHMVSSLHMVRRVPVSDRESDPERGAVGVIGVHGTRTLTHTERSTQTCAWTCRRCEAFLIFFLFLATTHQAGKVVTVMNRRRMIRDGRFTSLGASSGGRST